MRSLPVLAGLALAALTLQAATPQQPPPDDATLNNTMLNDGERIDAESQKAAPQQPQDHQAQMQQLQSMDSHLDSIDQQSGESAALQQQMVAMDEQNAALREAGQARAQAYGHTLQELAGLGNDLSYAGDASAATSLSRVSQTLDTLRDNASRFAGQQENVWLTQALQNLSDASDAIDASDYLYVQYDLNAAQANLRRALNATGGTPSVQ